MTDQDTWLRLGRVIQWPNVPRPILGETWASWLARAARYFGLTSGQFSAAVRKEAMIHGLDQPDTFMSFLGHLCGLTAADIYALRGQKLYQYYGNREACFCPVCWIEDDKAGVPLYWRHVWQEPLITMCHEHCYPLYDMVHVEENADFLAAANWVLDEFPVKTEKAIIIRKRIVQLEQEIVSRRLIDRMECYIALKTVMEFINEYWHNSRQGVRRPKDDYVCQRAFKIDPGCAFKTDPPLMDAQLSAGRL